MRKIGFVFCGLGALLILAFALADLAGSGGKGGIGAAQLLGIEIGILFILMGVGFVPIGWNGEFKINHGIRWALDKLLNLSPTTWVVSTFLALYLCFFIYPTFFSAVKIQYFVKYIPDAWVTRIGFDIETTVNHIGQWLVDKQSPYSAGTVPYSPLTLAIFAPLLLMGYPGYYIFLTVVTIVCYIFATLVIPAWMAPGKNPVLPLLFSILGLFSYGFQFEMERGQFNMIAFALCLLAIYIYHIHHEFRFFAYLLFCLSVQLKLYPFIFIVMFIKDWRDWKDNIKRMLGLGAINFSLLFVLGYPLFIEFIQNISARQLHFQSSRTEDLSIRGFVYSLSTDGLGSVPASIFEPYGSAIELFFLILFGACLASIILHAYRHNSSGVNLCLLAVCTLGALMIPTASFDYRLPILVAPVAMLLSDLRIIQNIPKRIVSIGLVIILSAAYWTTLYPTSVKPAFLSRNFPALFVILISTTILYFLRQGRAVSTVPESKARPDSASADSVGVNTAQR